MKKAGADPKVKKTLIRNYEKKITNENIVSHECLPSTSKATEKNYALHKTNELDQPKLCSSLILADYLNQANNALQQPLSVQDLKLNEAQVSAKMTKKLNFHFNDRMYKNLVELNTNDSTKSKVGKKFTKTKTSVTKDLEPNIDDFCDDEKDEDICPEIPIIKPKITRVRPVENGELHRLVASFENL